MPAAKGKGGAKATAKKSSNGNGVVPATAKRARSRGGRREAGIIGAGSKMENQPAAAAGAEAPLQWGRQKARGADPGAEHVDKPQVRHVPEATDEENLGFESLLQLADAGVHLEKRGRKRGKSAGTKGGKAGSKKGQADGGKGQVKKRGRGPNKVQESEEEREAKRLRRVQANRESARQTIRRKHELYDDLSGRAKVLEETNKTLRDQVHALYDEMKTLASKNTDLRNDIKVIAEEKGVPVPELSEQPETAPPPRLDASNGPPKPTRIAPKIEIGPSKPAAAAQGQSASVPMPVPQMWPPHAAFAQFAAAAASANGSTPSQAPPNPALMWPPAMIPNPYAMINPAALVAMMGAAAGGSNFPTPPGFPTASATEEAPASPVVATTETAVAAK